MENFFRSRDLFQTLARFETVIDEFGQYLRNIGQECYA